MFDKPIDSTSSLYKEIINEINLYEDTERASIALLILEYFFEITNTQILLDTPLNQPDEELLNDLKSCIRAVNNHEPIQYILGETEFYGLAFYVNSNVLIPRPETEELVDLIIKDQPKSGANILDIGTGSGCIAISLAHSLDAKVSAFDVSEKALEVAKDNALENEVDIEFIKEDILNPKENMEKYDIIVSNPPYVTLSEKALMKDNVLKNEPHLALFVEDDNPLIFYKAISEYALTHLNKGGKLYFEINEQFGYETLELALKLGFSSGEVIKDLAEKDRIVKLVI